MFEQISVLNCRHWSSCGGLNAQPLLVHAFSRFEAGDGFKSQITNNPARRLGSHHRKSPGQQLQRVRVSVIGQALGEEKQVELFRNGLWCSQRSLQQPRARREAERSFKPWVHQNSQACEVEQPAIGAQIRCRESHERDSWRCRQLSQSPKNSSV